MKQAIARAYGIPWAKHNLYEFDHLIPRELGGADSIKNIWPQSWPEARIKDKEENRLHLLVCSNQIELGEAQDRMRNWGK